MSKQQPIQLQEGVKGMYLGKQSKINPFVIVPSVIAKEDAHVNGFTLGKMGKGRNFIVRGEKQHG
ncbi:hypothetical protein [Bacillus toyonensis]|uniref:hypothetical protein n=1 Tax=Bacillus toyonensis TaxID=155322 RepID=UPI001C0CA25A|nr:hypothetical protein [Bacillus toyonensis]MBU4643161.1 hypothetical protein [Bacillus toyonensis]